MPINPEMTKDNKKKRKKNQHQKYINGGGNRVTGVRDNEWKQMDTNRIEWCKLSRQT